MEKSDKIFKELVRLTRTFRGEGGCPWDKKQTMDTLKVYIQQECQELMEALEKKSPEKAQEEMGDVIFLLLFFAEIARDKGDFSIGDVLENVKNKMVGRHPHVFEKRHVNGISEIRENWQKIKTREKNFCLPAHPQRKASPTSSRLTPCLLGEPKGGRWKPFFKNGRRNGKQSCGTQRSSCCWEPRND